MTATRTAPPVTVLRPGLPSTPFADELAAWLRAGIDTHPHRPSTGPAAPVVVIVPEYLRAAPRPLLAALHGRRWTGRPVGLVGYAGRTRARYALEDARDALHEAGATLIRPSLGLDVARWRTSGFDDADVLLRDLVLDELSAA